MVAPYPHPPPPHPIPKVNGESLRGLDTYGQLSDISAKGDKLYDFLFAVLKSATIMKSLL